MRFATETEIVIDLIRHGATPSNKEKRYIGRTDEDLDEEACSTLMIMQNSAPECELVASSPLRRATHTAELLFPHRKVICIPELTETDFGLFEGKTFQELNGNPVYQAFVDSNGETAFPEGESKAEASLRSVSGFRKVLNEIYAQGCKQAAIVAHGGTIMAIMSELTSEDYYDFHVSNLEGYEVTLKWKDKGNVSVSYHGIYGRIHSGSHTWRPL